MNMKSGKWMYKQKVGATTTSCTLSRTTSLLRGHGMQSMNLEMAYPISLRDHALSALR
jgi:hypothetical protein